MLNEKWIYDYEPLITQYQLKQVLYQRVKEDRDWDIKDISSQIISILVSIRNTKIKDLLNPHNEINLTWINKSFHLVDDWISGLVSWIENGYKETSDEMIISEEETNRYEGLSFLGNVLITTAKEPYIPPKLSYCIRPLSKLDLHKTVFETETGRKVAYGIYHYIRGKVTYKTDHLDLRPCDEFYFFQFSNLCHEHMLAVEDTKFESERIIGEVKNIKNILENLGVKADEILELQQILPASLCDYDLSCRNRLKVIAHQMTLTESMLIYKRLSERVKNSKCGKKLKGPDDFGKPKNNTNNKDESQWLKRVLDAFDDKCCSFCKTYFWLSIAITFAMEAE